MLGNSQKIITYLNCALVKRKTKNKKLTQYSSKNITDSHTLTYLPFKVRDTPKSFLGEFYLFKLI